VLPVVDDDLDSKDSFQIEYLYFEVLDENRFQNMECFVIQKNSKCLMISFFLRKNTKTPIFVAKITKTPLLNRHFINLSTYDNRFK